MARCYTGTKECGCLVAVSMTLDNKQVDEWHSYGYEIEDMDLEEARSKLKKCTC